MIRKGYNGGEIWENNKGEDFLIIPGPTGGSFYIDKESEELRKRYSPHFVTGHGFGPEGSDALVRKVAKIFPVMETFGGVSEQDLKVLAGTFSMRDIPEEYVELGLFREGRVKRKKIFYPTEKFARAFFNEYQK
ncbi:MAG: hypothetical protein ABFQ65_02065 [Nanoarchaeota archaeon]